jgi:hypothetical protein
VVTISRDRASADQIPIQTGKSQKNAAAAAQKNYGVSVNRINQHGLPPTSNYWETIKARRSRKLYVGAGNLYFRAEETKEAVEHR